MSAQKCEYVPSDLLHHVYTFLAQGGFQKAAKALQKASSTPLVEQSDSEPGLLQFFCFYQRKHVGNRTAIAEEEVSPSKKKNRKASEAVTETSSAKSEPNTNGDTKMEEEVSPPKKRKKKRSKGSEVMESMSLATNTNGDCTVEKEEEEGHPPSKKRKKRNKGSEVMEAEPLAKSEPNKKGKKNKQKETEPEDERSFVSSNEGSDGEDTPPIQALAESTPNTITASNEARSSDESDQSEEEEPVAAMGEEGTLTKKKKGKKGKSKGVVPFRRVSDTVQVDPRLMDNSFEAKAGAHGSWGAKANRDLKFTKGKSFRHEKTKKKRGTYKGGAINLSVCSVKFDSD